MATVTVTLATGKTFTLTYEISNYDQTRYKVVYSVTKTATTQSIGYVTPYIEKADGTKLDTGASLGGSITGVGSAAGTIRSSTTVYIPKTHAAQSVHIGLYVKYDSTYKYTNSSAITLNAMEPYAVSFSENGGISGTAPQEVVKFWDESFTIPSTAPSHPRGSAVEFRGWSTSPTGSVDYPIGSTYQGGANRTLYAVWYEWQAPKVTEVKAVRCIKNAAGAFAEDDSGKFALLSFKWEVGTDRSVSGARYTVSVSSVSDPASTVAGANATIQGASGTVKNVVLGDQSASVGPFSDEESYIVTVHVFDSNSLMGTGTDILSIAYFTMDFKAGGKGIAFGTPSVNDGFECAMEARFTERFDIGDSLRMVKADANGTDHSLEVITIPETDSGGYGHSAIVQAGTALIVGAGESASRMWSEGSGVKGTENLFLTSDNQIWFTTNADTFANRKSSRIDNTGLPHFGADTYISTASSIFTPASGFTLNGAYYMQRGKVAQLYVYLSTKNAISSGNISNIVLGTVSSGKRPSFQAAISGGDTGPTISGCLYSDGQISLGATASAMSANTGFNFCVTYLLP